MHGNRKEKTSGQTECLWQAFHVSLRTVSFWYDVSFFHLTQNHMERGRRQKMENTGSMSTVRESR